MNGYERIKAALNNEPTDTTPIMLHNFMMAAREYGVTMQQFRNDPKIISESFIKSVEKYQFDGVLVDIDTVTLAGAVGVPVDFPADEPARTNRGCLESIEDVRKLDSPNIQNYKYIQIWLESVRLIKEYFKDQIFVRGNCDQAPYTLASMMRGSGNWMMDLMMAEESLIFELLEYCTSASSQFISLMSETGADMVSNGDSPAGPDMISSDMYEKFALPFEKKVVQTAHNAGMKYCLHICGNTGIILDKMIDSGTDSVELDYKTDIKKVHEKCSGKVTFFGNIDPSGVLALGTVDLVREKTMELLEVYKNSNRFVLNAGCAMPPSTPEQNVFTMIRTAREFKS